MAVLLLTLTIEDGDGDTSAVTVYATQDDGDTVESLRTDYITVLWDTIRPLVSGVLVRASVALDMDISGLTNNSPSVLSDVEEKAIFHMRVCGGSRPVILSLPTIKETIFENGGRGKFVDITNSDYVAFAYVMSSALVDGGINATDSHGSDLCEVLYGEQSFKGR